MRLIICKPFQDVRKAFFIHAKVRSNKSAVFTCCNPVIRTLTVILAITKVETKKIRAGSPVQHIKATSVLFQIVLKIIPVVITYYCSWHPVIRLYDNIKLRNIERIINLNYLKFHTKKLKTIMGILIQPIKSSSMFIRKVFCYPDDGAGTSTQPYRPMLYQDGHDQIPPTGFQ